MPEIFIGNIKGEKGDVGTSLKILNYYTTLEELSSAVSNPNVGDAYGVGSSHPYQIYIYSENKGWVNNGALQPDINEQTPNYAEATTLTSLTSGEKISLAFGKIKKAIAELISHIANKNNPHGLTADSLMVKSIGGGTLINANDDLNSYTTIGNYICHLTANALTLSNCPAKGAFTMTVGYAVGTPSYLYQEVTHFNTGVKYYRSYAVSEKVWSEWRATYNTFNKPTLSDIGAAPDGHGLGTKAPPRYDSFKEMMQSGGGFYSIDTTNVDEVYDSPYPDKTWIGLLQVVRDATAGSETGSQLAFRDLDINNPKMWLRSVRNNGSGNWVEMLHTGNIEDYRHKIVTGAYTGDSALLRKISLDFTPDVVLVFGKSGMVSFLTPDNGYRGCGGMAFKGFPCKVGDTATIEIVDGGFNVAYIAPNGDATANVPMTNESGAQYYYMAIRQPIK